MRIKVILIGIGGTFATDCWSLVLKFFGINSRGLLIIGSWLSSKILDLEASLNQSWIIGWTSHYLLGIVLAFLFILIYKKRWFNNPKISSALLLAQSL